MFLTLTDDNDEEEEDLARDNATIDRLLLEASQSLNVITLQNPICKSPHIKSHQSALM